MEEGLMPEDFESTSNQQKRAELKKLPAIKHEVDRLWRGREHLRFIDYQDYHLSVYCFLTHVTAESLDVESAWDAAFEDWDNEAKESSTDGDEMLVYAGFFESVFELVDLNTTEVDESTYESFVKDLSVGIGVGSADDFHWTWRWPPTSQFEPEATLALLTLHQLAESHMDVSHKKRMTMARGTVNPKSKGASKVHAEAISKLFHKWLELDEDEDLEDTDLTLSELRSGLQTEALPDAVTKALRLPAEGSVGWEHCGPLVSLFRKLDVDGDGCIDPTDLEQAIFAEANAPSSLLGKLKTAGIAVERMLGVGFSLAQLKTAGYTAKQIVLASAEVSPKDLVSAGFTAKQMVIAGFSAAQLLSAGLTAQQLKMGGMTQQQLGAGAGGGTHKRVSAPTDSKPKGDESGSRRGGSDREDDYSGAPKRATLYAPTKIMMMRKLARAKDQRWLQQVGTEDRPGTASAQGSPAVWNPLGAANNQVHPQ